MKIDLYDKKILAELDRDARISAAKIGKKIQLPKESVNYRIKRLIKRGIIVYFNTLINASEFGSSYYRVSFKLLKHTKKEEAKIVEFLLNQSSCTNIRLTEGPHDIVFIAIHENARDFSNFISTIGKKLGNLIMQRNIGLISRSEKFSQKLMFDNGSGKIIMQHDRPAIEQIDYSDMKILKQLALKGRSQLSEISKSTGLKPGVVRYRIKNMEKSGVIAGYSTLVDFEKLGYNFIQIDFCFKNPDVATSVLEYFDTTKQLARSYTLLGRYDLSIEMYVESDMNLRDIMDTFRERFRKDYLYYDISRIFKNYVTSWSPFTPLEEEKIREIRLQD